MKKVFLVENGYTVWSAYDNRKDAEDMAEYLNRKYRNGYFVTEEGELKEAKTITGTEAVVGTKSHSSHYPYGKSLGW